MVIDDAILSNLSELEELSLANNKLTVFPPSIIDMNKLKRLNMSHNQLR